MPLAVEQAEEIAEVAVEREQLEAHLRAFGAVAVADDSRSPTRPIERMSVAGAAAELHFLEQRRGEREGRAIEFGRGAEMR